MNNIVRGFIDNWESKHRKLKFIVNILNDFADRNNFQSVSLPTIEFEETFLKTLGITSDIVQKQFFYIKNTNKNKNIVMRPELTSGLLRAVVEKKILFNKNFLNIYTFGKCFRYEKPQKGRYREFNQWNLEQLLTNEKSYLYIFSFLNLVIDFFKLKTTTILKINFLSLIQLEKAKLLFEKEIDNFELCEICLKRAIKKNVYRILDCKKCGLKVSEKIDLYSLLSEKDLKKYEKIFEELKVIFPNLKIEKVKNLTRGLDYYNGVVFELSYIKKDEEWAKNTILGGGEYFLSSLNNKFIELEKGIGFAIGIERFLICLEENNFFDQNVFFNYSTIFISISEDKYKYESLSLVNKLISNKYKVFNNIETLTFYKSLQKTLQKEADWLIFFGKEYKINNKVLVKKINKKNSEKIQFFVSISKVIETLKNN